MHNFVKSNISIEESLESVKKKLHSPKKEFFATHKDELVSLYHNYDDLATRDELHTLQPHLNDRDNRCIAYELYGSNRPFVNYHWEKLTELNGGETLICPICGLKDCEEMDHFLPREENMFPEYSTHLTNLIPLCHSCNHNKSTKFLDAGKNRLFFNAYFDILTKRDIVVCTIELSTLDSMPQVKVEISPSLSAEQKPEKYILSTIKELELVPRFRNSAKIKFKNELNRLKIRANQDWESIKKEYVSLYAIERNYPDIVYPAVLKAIAESSVMEEWFQSL